MGHLQQVQEAGLPFYGYAILTHALVGGERLIFRSLFWALIFVTVSLHLTALVFNTRFQTDPNSPFSAVLVKIGIGYFVSIAMAECLSAVFLLRKFHIERQSAMSSPLSGGKLCYHLMRSTAMRVTILASFGVSRAVTTSLTSLSHEASDGQKNLASMLDMLVYSMTCFFPIVIL